jgi:hypothetical protein
MSGLPMIAKNVQDLYYMCAGILVSTSCIFIRMIILFEPIMLWPQINRGVYHFHLPDESSSDTSVHDPSPLSQHFAKSFCVNT